MIDKKKKILYVYPKRATFIETDLQLLSEKYDVTENTDAWFDKAKTPYLLLKQFVFLLRNIHKYVAIVVSFGGYWAFLPSLMAKCLKKPVFIILHGTDAVAFDEINYGNLRKFPLRWVLKWSYFLATRLLPVSESLIYTENNYFAENKMIRQGIRHFFPNLATPYTIIPNAFDAEKWQVNEGTVRRQQQCVTVMGEGQFFIKGGELIVGVADLLPDIQFLFVGIEKPTHLTHIPNNVKFLGRMQSNELIEWYSQSQFYLQLSNTEGFGCALCEAMLCGCTPIVSAVNVLPYIVGHTGFVLEKRNVQSLQILFESIENQHELGKENGRDRIISLFSLENRQNLLYHVIDKEIRK